MALTPMTKWKERTQEERRRLEAGEKPKPRLTSKLQRTAARALAAFFALMVGLTLLARAADGITVARVQADRPKTGVLTQRVTVSGAIQPLGDLELTLPGGIRVSGILAEQGDRVHAGETLMELDLDDLRDQLTTLGEKLRILNLRLEASEAGNTEADLESVLAAEQALADAREDYVRLQEKLDRTGGRLEEDLQDVQAEYDKAVLDLAKAERQAKKDLVEAAEKDVEAAEDSLKAVKEAAELAIEGAQSSLTSAQDAKKSSNKNYYEAADRLDKLEETLSGARKELEDLIAQGAAQPEIDEAQAQVDELKAAVESAQWSMGSYDYGGDLGVKRAQENLRKVQERQAEKVKEAEAEVREAKDKLAEAEDATDVSDKSGVISAQSAVDAAEKAVKTAQRAIEDGEMSDEDQLYTARRAVEKAQRALADASRKAEDEARKTLLADEKTRQQAEIERLGYRSEKRTVERDMARLQAVVNAGGKLTAPVDGTVQTILAEPGRTQDGARLCALSRNDQGFTFEGRLAQEEAEELAVGDAGEVSFTQEGKAQTAKGIVSAIGAADEKGAVAVTVDLPEGAYASGVSARFEISKRSEQYRSVLPLGALRSEGGTYYVLVMQEKQTVLGTEQTVVKLQVDLLEQDSENVAVEGALIGDERVVTSSSKPIEEGDRVRLEEAAK